MASVEDVLCAECGARPKDQGDRFCAFCGTELRRPVPAVPTPSETREARFAAARRSEAYSRARTHEPSVGHVMVGGACGTAFFGVFTVVAVGISGIWFTAGSLVGGEFGLLALVPLGMAAFGVVMAAKSALRTSSIATSPTEHHLALVRDKRVAVSGGGKNTSAATQDYVTLEYEGGHRKEHAIDSRLAGRIASGDVGVACERGGFLVDFVELDA